MYNVILSYATCPVEACNKAKRRQESGQGSSGGLRLLNFFRQKNTRSDKNKNAKNLSPALSAVLAVLEVLVVMSVLAELKLQICKKK